MQVLEFKSLYKKGAISAKDSKNGIIIIKMKLEF
jgi:hypothetical protein